MVRPAVEVSRQAAVLYLEGTAESFLLLTALDSSHRLWARHEDLAEGRFPCSPEVLLIAVRLCWEKGTTGWSGEEHRESPPVLLTEATQRN
jgi:hypothetical protein